MHSLYSATFRAKTSTHNWSITIQYNCTLDEIRLITCWVKKKKNKKLININVIIRHSAIVVSCDEQFWRYSFSLFKQKLRWNYTEITQKLTEITQNLSWNYGILHCVVQKFCYTYFETKPSKKFIFTISAIVHIIVKSEFTSDQNFFGSK